MKAIVAVMFALNLAVVGATADGVDWQKVLTMVDVGSGGTRLSVYKADENGLVQACCHGGDDPCIKEGADNEMPNRDRQFTYVCPGGEPNANRYQDGVTTTKITGCVDHQMKMLYLAIKEEAQEDARSPCASLVADTDAAGFTEKIKKSLSLTLFATAGARRLENKNEQFNKIMVDGFKAYFGTGAGATKVKGGILEGPMEGYFGLNTGAIQLSNMGISATDIRKKMIYIEVGGASQQAGWYTDYEDGRKASGAAAVRFKALRGTAQGPLEMEFPANKLAPAGRGVLKSSHQFAHSILGDGADRLAYHLAHFAIKEAAKQTDPAKKKVALNPCFLGKEGTAGQVTELVLQSGQVTWKDEDKSAKFGAATKNNVCNDMSKDGPVKSFLAKPGHMIMGSAASYSGKNCLDFMNEMFANEVDETDTHPKYTTLFSKQAGTPGGGGDQTKKVKKLGTPLATKLAHVKAGATGTIVAVNSKAVAGGLKWCEKAGIIMMGHTGDKLKRDWSFTQLKTVAEESCKIRLECSKGLCSKYDFGVCYALTEVVAVRRDSRGLIL